MCKISKEKEFKTKRIHAVRKKVLQYRDRLDEIESILGREEAFVNEWRDLALAKSLLIFQDEQFLYLQDMILDLTEILGTEMGRLTQIFMEAFQKMNELLIQLTRPPKIKIEGEPMI